MDSGFLQILGNVFNTNIIFLAILVSSFWLCFSLLVSYPFVDLTRPLIECNFSSIRLYLILVSYVYQLFALAEINQNFIVATMIQFAM